MVDGVYLRRGGYLCKFIEMVLTICYFVFADLVLEKEM